MEKPWGRGWGSGGSRGGVRGARPPYFSIKMRPEGPKKVFWRPAPLLISGVWMTLPLPLSEGLDPPLRGSIYPPLVPWWGV